MTPSKGAEPRIRLSDLKKNPRNPRTISRRKMEDLKDSIKRDPEFMKHKPILIDKHNVIRAGNQRYEALLQLGYEDVPKEWIDRAEDLSEAKLKRYVIMDNTHFGEWDPDIVEADYGFEKIKEDYFDIIPQPSGVNGEEGELQFSVELDDVSNYVVLKFDSDIDWLNVQTILGLVATHSRRQNGKPWSKGIGRVVNGPDAIEKIRKA